MMKSIHKIMLVLDVHYGDTLFPQAVNGLLILFQMALKEVKVVLLFLVEQIVMDRL